MTPKKSKCTRIVNLLFNKICNLEIGWLNSNSRELLESDKINYSNIEKTQELLVRENRHFMSQEEDLTARYSKCRHFLREAESRKKLLMLQDEIEKMKIEKSKALKYQKSILS